MTISNRNTKYKRSGSILASVMVAAIVWIMIAQSMFITFSGQFKMISSSRTALQAQQYAEIALDKLKNINYDELDAYGVHGRQKIDGISSAEWQDEVTIGAESTIAGSDDAKQRIATVNVYKVGDTIPRYTVEVPLSSQGNSGNKIFPDYSYPHAVTFPYTAPCDGFLWLCLFTANGWWSISINDTYIYFNSSVYGSSSEMIPISKNDIVNIHPSYGYPCDVYSASFFPCK